MRAGGEGEDGGVGGGVRGLELLSIRQYFSKWSGVNAFKTIKNDYFNPPIPNYPLQEIVDPSPILLPI